ncbi:MAG: Gfo/Idh/MocA family oxidoreductase, partial [Armatimonadetes bacterium]|nr:Gfo/Idh/MocA family oxidoreductase [Armatimonadota bacterium]
MTENGISRREFLAGAAAGIALAGAGLTSSRAFAANDRISIGMIGVGVRGNQLFNDIKAVDKALNAEVTAICDTWRVRREQMAAKVKERYGADPKGFSNYEDLLALKDVDAVVIATPDFSHARILADAIKAGKDVFIEKPLAKDLDQANAAMDAFKASKCVVQVGTQRRSEGNWKAAAKLVQSGVLGAISRVEVGWNDCGPRWRQNVSGIKAEDVDWKRFLMHLPDRPFDPHHYGEWQLYRDYTNGPIAVLGAHYFDVGLWLTDTQFPSNAVANGGQYVWKDGREHEDTIYAIFDFQKGFAMRYLTGLGNLAQAGLSIYGTNGVFKESTWSASGEGGRGADMIKEEIKVSGNPNENHMGNWLECVRRRQKSNARFEVGYQHSICTMLVDQALVTGGKMKYLPTLLRI